MPQVIDIPGAGKVEFPDGMSDADIVAAIKRNRLAWGAANPASQASPAVDAPHGPGVLERIGHGLRDPISGGAQLLTKMLPDAIVNAGNTANNWLADKTGMVARLPAGGVDQQVREQEAAYQQRRKASGQDGVDWWRLAGNVANPANVALASGLPAAASFGGRVAASALGGGLAGMLEPVTSGDFAGQKATQIGVGALAGGAVPVIAGGLSRIVSPKASVNPDVAALAAEDIRPTVGQTLGGRWNRAEEKLMSVPVLGDAIGNARVRATGDLQRAVANRALAPIGQQLPTGVVGRDAVAYVKTSLGDAYDNLLPKLTVQADQPFAAKIASLQHMVGTGSVSPNAATAFDRILQNDVLGKFRGQSALTGQTFKDIEGDLGVQIKRLGASTDADQRLIADALGEVRSELRSLLVRSNPQAADALGKINAGYAVFKRMERAASTVGAEDGAFNAAQLQSAVKALDRSKDHGGFARGAALLQDLSDPAKNVLGSKVPNSGTTDRALVASLPAYALGLGPMATMLSGPALYSTPGQAMLRAMVASRPAQANRIAGLLNDASTMLGPAGGLLGLQMANQ